MKIKELNIGLQIDVGAPTPTILSSEHEVYLIFYVDKPNPNWNGTYVNVRSNSDDGIVTVKLSQYAQFKFGNPNDEAINGHPYYKHGLQPYAIQEVLESDWIEDLRHMNSVHPYHKDEHFKTYRHLIFFFHDTCFEIVCRNMEILDNTEPTLKKEIKRISELISA
ncbi:MAG: hypothetical protein ABJG99_09790 [Crocinitomicaceae bacterium]